MSSVAPGIYHDWQRPLLFEVVKTNKKLELVDSVPNEKAPAPTTMEMPKVALRLAARPGINRLTTMFSEIIQVTKGSTDTMVHMNLLGSPARMQSWS
jgi:hypothetical protein